MKHLVKNKKVAYLIILFCTLLWGSAFPLVKITYKELGVNSSMYFEMIFLAGIRFFLAGVFVFIVMLLFDKKALNQIKPNLLFLSKLSIIVTTFGYLFFYIGTGNTSGMKSAIITASSTFLVAIFSHFMLSNEKFNKFKLIAIILGLLGTIFANINKEFNLNFSLMGEGFMFINSTIMAFGTVYVKKYGKDISSFTVAFGQFILGSIPLIIIGYMGKSLVFAFSLYSIMLIIYGGLLSATAFSLWYFILNEYKASEITFMRLFIPFFGTFLSAVTLGESLNFGIVIGLIFVILGIIIINKSHKIKD